MFYGVSQIHKNSLSETEKYPLNYTTIYEETETFRNILVRQPNPERCHLKLQLTLV